MIAVLGLDTSCYTTSAALVSLDGELLRADRRLLRVPVGKRGLMQSEMVFQHVQALPERIAAVTAELDVQIAAVSASTRPRPADDSYMPAFRAGESQARTAARLLRVPFYPFSHQEGHVRAAAYETEIDLSKPLLALHLSGGTTEVLRCEQGQITCIGGSMDLHAGQLIDRVGVALGMPFPAGPYLEKAALHGEAHSLLPVSMEGPDCHFSGAEARVSQWIREGKMPPEQIAAEVFSLVARTVLRLLSAAREQTGVADVLITGGVASSQLLRDLLNEINRKRRLGLRLYFGQRQFAGDNAAGVALIGCDRLREGKA